MKKYSYLLNPNALSFRCLVNLVYFTPILILFLIFQLFQIKLKFNIQLLGVFFYIIIVEYLHHFKYQNSTVIDCFYVLKHNIKIKLKEIFYLYIYKNLPYIHILFLVFSLWYFICKPFSNDLNDVDLTNFINTIITITSIILTLILGLLQHLQNSFSDSINLINEWKKNTIYLFVILAIYTILGLTAKCFELNIVVWIYCCSIYMVIQLFALGTEALILMNDTGIIDINKFQLLEIINKIPTSTNIETMIQKYNDKSIKNKLKNWIVQDIIGIVPNINSNTTISHYFNSEIKPCLESLFRIANIYIKHDKYILYQNSMSTIKEVFSKIIIKTNGNPDFDIYEYFVSKYTEIKDIVLEENKELYLECLSDLLISITKKAISIANSKHGRLSNSTSLAYLIDEIIKLIKDIALYQHTTVATSMIIELKTLVQMLLDKNDTMLINTIIESLGTLSIEITVEYNKSKIKCNAIWITNLLAKIMYTLVNIIFYIVFDSFKSAKTSYNYLFELIKKNYYIIFNVYFACKFINNTPFVSIYNPNNFNIEFIQFYDIVAGNIKVKTPYKNIMLQGGMRHISDVSSLFEVFALVFISDLDSKKDFTSPISCLINILDVLKGIDIKTVDTLSLSSLDGFYNDVIKALNIFMLRIDYFNFNIKKNYQLIKIFLEKLLEISFVHFEKFYNNDSSDEFIEKYLEFLANTYIIFNEKFKIEIIILDFIDKIINIYDCIQDNKFLKKQIYISLKLFHLYIFEYDKSCKLFDLIKEFINKNKQYYKLEDFSENIEYKFENSLISEYLQYIQIS